MGVWKVWVLTEDVAGFYNDYQAVRGVFTTLELAEEGKKKLLEERAKHSIGYSSDWSIDDFELDKVSE
jgi:hypothetical protein